MIIGAAALALLVGGCAAASNPGAMMVPVSETTIIGKDSALRQSVSLGTIGGGKETSPLWKSNISNEDFAEALRQSLAAHAMLAGEAGGAYTLTAELTEVKQPLVGFDMTVTTAVKYTLTNAKTGETVFSEVITTPYTAKMSDAFVGTKRLQLANEGSARENIGELIRRMIAAVDNAKGEAGALISRIDVSGVFLR
jgi:hypothetical protein